MRSWISVLSLLMIRKCFGVTSQPSGFLSLSGNCHSAEGEAELQQDGKTVGGRRSDSCQKPDEPKDSQASGPADSGSHSGEEAAQ